MRCYFSRDKNLNTFSLSIQELVCSNQQQNADELLKMVADSPHEYCLPQKARVILIVIDALKYEFGLFDSSEYTHTHTHARERQCYHQISNLTMGISFVLCRQAYDFSI